MMKKTFGVVCAVMAATVVLAGSAFAEETWNIGGIGPTTGDAAAYGNGVKFAMEIAAEEINEAGGIGGYEVKLNFQDDQADAQQAMNAYNTLTDWGMQILEGTVTSTACAAVADLTYEDGMLQLTPSGSSPACIVNDNAFAVCFSDPAQGAASARYIGEHGMAEKVAVIYNSDVYSTGIYETFMDEAENQPFEVVYEEAFTDETSKDFSVQLQGAMDAGADLVFLPIYYQPASLILTQADSMGYEPLFFGVDGMDGILGVENFDTSLAEGVVLLTPFVADAEDEMTVNFVSRYEELHGEIPNQFAADAYDGLYIIKAAIEHAGVTPDMAVDEIGEALKVAMTEIEVDGLTGMSMTWDETGAPEKDPKAVVIQDGVYVGMED